MARGAKLGRILDYPLYRMEIAHRACNLNAGTPSAELTRDVETSTGDWR